MCINLLALLSCYAGMLCIAMLYAKHRLPTAFFGGANLDSDAKKLQFIYPYYNGRI